MGGFFGVASKDDCVFDLFFGTDYHSHLGTRRAGMAVYGEDGFDRAIHNIENAPFRTKFDKDMQKMKGYYGIGCISDFEPQPLIVRSHHGTFAITTVGKINNAQEIVDSMADLTDVTATLVDAGCCLCRWNDSGEYALYGITGDMGANYIVTLEHADQTPASADELTALRSEFWL